MTAMEPIQSGVRLRVLEGASQAKEYLLERSLISLGRSTPESLTSPSYITFPEPTVSRLHAVLTWEAGARAFLLHHRSQTNPTVLNNTVIAGPELLKPGDRITLGRLIMVVEAETGAHIDGAASPPDPRQQLTINAKREDGERVFSAPIKERFISLTFANDRSTLSPSPARAGWQDVRLPSGVGAALRFELDAVAGTCTVEAGSNDQAASVRLSQGGAGTQLRVPVRAGQTLPFVETDVILHQGYLIWLGNPDESPDAESTLSQKPQGPHSARARQVTLQFLNGPWMDAVISARAQGTANVRIGPGETGFRHPFPLTHAPHCEITVHDGSARLRAIEVADDQFLEVDGELILASESVPLVGGSSLLVGDAEFVWSDGSEASYASYRLVDGSAVYPIRKALVRLGTAAHCEVMLPHRELSPVIGEINFQSGTPVYHQLDITAPIRADGEETSTGLSVALRAGSVLELRRGMTLRLEQAPPVATEPTPQNLVQTQSLEQAPQRAEV